MLTFRALLIPLSALCLLSSPQNRGKSDRSHAVISGTVFREPGFSLPGAEIELEPDAKGKTSVKVKKMKALSDSRGEFAFRVPAEPMSYTLSFRARGFQPEQRSVAIAGEERQDVFVTLKARESSQ